MAKVAVGWALAAERSLLCGLGSGDRVQGGLGAFWIRAVWASRAEGFSNEEAC